MKEIETLVEEKSKESSDLTKVVREGELRRALASPLHGGYCDTDFKPQDI